MNLQNSQNTSRLSTGTSNRDILPNIDMTDRDGMKERFWDLVFDYRHLVRILFYLDVILLVMIGFASLFVMPGTDAYIITIIDSGLLLVVLVVIIGLLWGSSNRG